MEQRITYKMLSPVYMNKYTWVIENRPSGRILDVGCGNGEYLRKYKGCIGVDVREMVHPRFLQASAEHLPLPNKSFDTVLCMDVLEHVDDDERSMEEIQRVLKKGGRCILSVPSLNYPWPYDPINKILNLFNLYVPIGLWAWGHKRLYTLERITRLLTKHGFVIQKIERCSHFLVALCLNYLPYLLGDEAGLAKKKHFVRWSFLFSLAENLRQLDKKLFRERSGTHLLIVAEKVKE